MVQNQFDKNMGITYSDFYRLLPRAMGEHSYTVTNKTVNVDIATGGKLTLNLGEQQERRIALMCIPYVIVSFDFDAVADDQKEAFMQHFDLHFQRGGG